MFMIVKIDKLSHDFRGISRINDKVLFIPSVLPEEVVDVRITIDKKNYSIGKAMNIITESSNRRKSICPYFDTCGGCSTGYIKYDKALVYKKESAIDIMKRYAGYDVKLLCAGRQHKNREQFERIRYGYNRKDIRDQRTGYHDTGKSWL